MKRNSSTGLISDPIVGSNRSLYRTVESMQLELNRSIEKELRGFRGNSAVTNVVGTYNKMSATNKK